MIQRDGQPQMPPPEDNPGEASRLGDLIERFAELAEATAEDRERYLAELAERTPGVADALRRMLEAEASDGASALDGSPLDLAAALEGEPGTIAAMPSALPAVGGRYEIRRPLGFGSHGDVYLARQHEPVERDVAIKVLRPSQVSSTTSERMVREAGMLATLNHPGIATVHEAGQTDDGRPYIVTEFVDGAPIDRWCGQVGADARTRCMVLARVCRAVEHMHQRGVIHRDLKPTNILVAGGVSDPRPKLVDLGIARILRADGVEAPPTLTQEGALLGSVGYIAPEQFGGAPADTRSDIFALGRVLRRVLEDADDPWLSRRARDAGAIMRRAMAPEPGDRYQSVGDLAEDLEALLADRPVVARRASAFEAALRLVRRHKITTVLAIIAVGSTAGTIATLAHTSDRLHRTNEAQKALLKETLGGLTVVLSRYGGTVDQRKQLASRMDSQVARMLEIAPTDRELHILRAGVLTERARLLIDGRQIDEALTAASTAVALMDAHVLPASATLEELQQMLLAIVVEGDAYAQRGEFPAARKRYERVLDLQRQASDRFPDDTAVRQALTWSYDRLTYPKWIAVDPAYEPTLLERARLRLALSEELVRADPENALARYTLAMGYFRLGHFLRTTGDLTGALEALGQARAEFEPIAAREPQRTDFVVNLAHAWFQLSLCLRDLEAPVAARDAIERCTRVLEGYISALNRPDGRSNTIVADVAQSLLNEHPSIEAQRDRASTELARRLRTLRDLKPLD